MTPIENLHFALGELAYAMARADGTVQKEERLKFRAIIESELKAGHDAYGVSDIIFQVLARDKTDTETTYSWAMNAIRLNSHYLSPEMKQTFIRVMEKIAEAFPPVEASEHNLLERFRRDIAPIEGDPVFYRKSA